jgi:hypothetical protein
VDLVPSPQFELVAISFPDNTQNKTITYLAHHLTTLRKALQIADTSAKTAKISQKAAVYDGNDKRGLMLTLRPKQPVVSEKRKKNRDTKLHDVSYVNSAQIGPVSGPKMRQIWCLPSPTPSSLVYGPFNIDKDLPTPDYFSHLLKSRAIVKAAHNVNYTHKTNEVYRLMPFLESNFNSQHSVIAIINPPVSPPPPPTTNPSTQPPPRSSQDDDSVETQHVSKRQCTTTPSGHGQEEVQLDQTFGVHQDPT